LIVEVTVEANFNLLYLAVVGMHGRVDHMFPTRQYSLPCLGSLSLNKPLPPH